MKRVLIMKEPPKLPAGEGRKKAAVITAHLTGGILILDYFKTDAAGEQQWKARHCLNTETNEYETYFVTENIWTTCNLTAMYDKSYYRSAYSMNQEVEMDPESMKLALAVLKTDRANLYAVIEDREQDRNKEKRDRGYNRKRERVHRLMDSVPHLPAGARDWITKVIGKNQHYAFYDKKTGEWKRTCCKEPGGELVRADGGKKIRHNDEVICTACGARLTAKKRTDKIKREAGFLVLQRIDPEKSVARHMKATVEWDGEGIHTWLDEEIRILLHRGLTPKCTIYYYQESGIWLGNRWYDDETWWDSNRSNKRTRSCYLYPDGIEEALKQTGYEKWSRLFSQMAEKEVQADYNRLMAAGIGIRETIEYLFKGRFWKMLEETTDYLTVYGSYYGKLNLHGENEREVFQLEDRQKILRLREINGGEAELEWLRYAEEKELKISQETLEWLVKNKVVPNSIRFIDHKMTPQQVMNYVKKQKETQYPGLMPNGILGQWADYISMCRVPGKNLDDEMVYRPKELKRRHDEMVIYAQKARILEGMDSDPERSQQYADEMAEKFPGAEENLKAAKPKYEYENEEYRITVPERLVDIVKEGNALHHCAGSSERYFERLMSRETYICFLRRREEPEIPFYTIEIEPNGTIRQHRSYLDEEPGIDEIRGFLREWQQVIKKRIKKEDLELQKISAEKRKQNLQDLREKNNTRVIQGLMEDFMEAI